MGARTVGSIRVLFFVAEYDRLYGGQRSLLSLVRNLPLAGVEPIVAFPGEGSCTAAYREAGVRVEIVPAPVTLHAFGQHLLHIPSWQKMKLFITSVLPYSFQVGRLMKRLGAHVLHCNTVRSLLFAGPAAFLQRYPVVWHVRGQLHAINRTLQFACQIMASRIVLVAASLQQADIYPQFWHKCRTIYNGIDDDAVACGNSESVALPCPVTNGRPIVATVAAVTPFKGHHYLVQAARLINQRFSERQPIFLVIGDLFDQPYVDYLRRLIHQYELDNFYFLGWQQNPFRYYQLADVVVLPTVEREQLDIGDAIIEVRSGEGLPRTLLEAMYFGKPVVATVVAGTREQIQDGETGLLVPPAQPEALARAIIHLLQVPETVRQEMGRKAAQRVRECFTTERMVRETVAMYRELVDDGS